MPRLTDQGLQKINDLAQHYGVSVDAVMTLLQALLNSKGTMAQFDHRELGGAGQWMRRIERFDRRWLSSSFLSTPRAWTNRLR